MFITLDSPDDKLLAEVHAYVDSVDDLPVVGVEELNWNEYFPNGGGHLLSVDSLPESWSTVSAEIRATHRWIDMFNASRGLRSFSDNDHSDSPVYSGKLPRTPEDFAKMVASARFAENRASYFREFNVNYIGRTNLSPRNIIVLDNKKGNPHHDPRIDPSLIPLYASMEDDWWGSCGIVSSGNVDRLGAFFDEFIDEVIPLGYTTGSHAKLKSFGVDFAKIPAPVDDPKWGTQVREIANRLSYDLSL